MTMISVAERALPDETVEADGAGPGGPASVRTSYASWAAAVFDREIAPVIWSLRSEILPGVDSSPWLRTCGPGSTEGSAHRLFPGSLFLLWIQALSGDKPAPGASCVAAAIELLHNASLVHDDVLDSHAVRKAEPTLYGRFGGPFALLAGDGLAAAALLALRGAPAGFLPVCLDRLGHAMQDLVAGQLLDEPDAWRGVPPARWSHYWLEVCRGKLAMGNVSGPLAAVWAGQPALESTIRDLLREYSVISQVINDFGDAFGYAGYHRTAPSSRVPGEEGTRKPTLPQIWSGARWAEGAPPPVHLVEQAREEIRRRKQAALETLGPLVADDEAGDILRDFFEAPDLPPDAPRVLADGFLLD